MIFSPSMDTINVILTAVLEPVMHFEQRGNEGGG